MTNTYHELTKMLKTVARALGDDLLGQIVFVGGCTTGLFITDSFTKEEVRYTDDVDFMPDDETILGFTNRWYTKALETAQDYALADDITIKLLSPPMFIATKLEAYLGRGDDDPLASHDLEDILNLVDGREELLTEIEGSDEDICSYIASQISDLLAHVDFEYAVRNNVRDNKDRADLIFERLEVMKRMI